MNIPQLLVHGSKDNVGVVVVEGVTAGSELLCVDISNNTDFKVTANADIPLGHKIALKSMDQGATVFKYGEDMGRVIESVSAGDHLHVHNCKTKRW